MNYSFMTFSCPELTLDEALYQAKTIGYDGIEIRSEADHQHGVELQTTVTQREEIRGKIEDSGIAICCIATSCVYADPTKVAGKVKLTNQFIDLAGDIGCSRLRVFGGRLPEGTTREEATAQIIESLASVADHAAERGVVVCIETHDDWTDPKHLVAVMEKVNHTNIALNWDIMHPVNQSGYSIEDSYQLLKPWIKHVHVHDGTFDEAKNATMVPIGEGLIDHQKALELLKSQAYDGFISGEWIGWEPWETHLPRELATMKDIEKGLD